MANSYIEYDFTVTPLQPAVEILIAQLAEVGFESFVETETGLQAYIQKEEWTDSVLKDVSILNSKEFTFQHSHSEIEQINWNEAWEQNFSPITVDDICAVRAPFHKSFDVPYEIIISPKMSFGTGHHETTFMMLQYILKDDFTGKKVLDMGCGTTVLGIMAELKGATEVMAIDIDDWCVENSEENIKLNNCKNITVKQGDAAVLPPNPQFDIILANINKNILLQDIPAYSKCLRDGGVIYFSGFYKDDLEDIKEVCNKNGLQYVGNKQRNDWIAAKFVTLAV
ncbi:50S ribosomal protein L11 methyltransferase [Flavobacteriaceae bacterium TK19130]|nr:50S ribosomal protein L11 methyltransferase [Thermobacterium salinum]